MTEGTFGQHLEESEVAAYVDGAVSDDALAQFQAHLATCAECRAEIAEVLRITASLPSPRRVPRRLRIPAAAAAAAAVVVLLAWPRAPNEIAPLHREAAVTTTVAPRPLMPLGTVDSVTAFVWSSVPFADNYRVRAFNNEGTVIWERITVDTAAPRPGAGILQAGPSYYWRVEARTGFDRVTESDLTEFVVRRRGPR